MTNLFFQGKIIRQFWGKLIRQSTERGYIVMDKYIINATWGGGSFINI